MVVGGCRSLVAEHWRLKPEALGLIPGSTTFFLSLCRFKGLRTVMAQIISIGLRTWVSPVYRAPYAVIRSRFFRNHISYIFISELIELKYTNSTAVV